MWKTTLENTSKLTLELRDVIAGGVKLWDFEYPSFYEGVEKAAFEQKVIDHYYFRQIGQETVGRFLHMFRTRIREIMPYYIDVYKSVKIMHELDNPFDNVDVTETFSQTSSGTASGTASGESSGTESTTGTGSETSERTDTKTVSDTKTHKFSNTPQGSISNLDSYLTEASVDLSDGSEQLGSTATGSSESAVNATSSGSASQTSSSHSSGTVTHTLTRKGNQGVNTFAHDIMEYRKSIINVDMMIINELNDLFLGIY